MRYRTWTAVAESLGCNRSGLVRLRRREDWPAPAEMPARGLTQQQVDAIRQWREGLPRAGDTGASDINLQHRREQTAYMRVRRELLEGRYIEQTLHEAAMVALADVYVRACDHLPTTIATAVPNLTPEQRGQVERIVREHVIRERQRIAGESTLTLPQSLAHASTGLGGFHRDPARRQPKGSRRVSVREGSLPP